MHSLLVVFGTRPEAVKLCPVVRSLRAQADSFQVKVCVTAQHREMLDQVLEAFEITPDYDLDLMQPGQTLLQSTARILAGLEPVIEHERPEMVVVQGDTTTTFCGALAAFYQGIPVSHVEAGLRTGDVRQPFPEEMNRLLTSRLSALHFAPTQEAADNLVREGIDPRAIEVTGNTGIDAVIQVRDGLESGRLKGFTDLHLNPSKKLVLVTAHRRESFGDGFECICRALVELASREDVQIVFPVHPNPNVRRPVEQHLAGHDNILLLEPLGYVTFVDLMRNAHMILTDSGGIQEEAPCLGKPVLVLREKTERPEAVAAGTARTVGTSVARIVSESIRLLEDKEAWSRMARVHNAFGDGKASQRIATRIGVYLQSVFARRLDKPQ